MSKLNSAQSALIISISLTFWPYKQVQKFVYLKGKKK